MGAVRATKPASQHHRTLLLGTGCGRTCTRLFARMGYLIPHPGISLRGPLEAGCSFDNAVQFANEDMGQFGRDIGKGRRGAAVGTSLVARLNFAAPLEPALNI